MSKLLCINLLQILALYSIHKLVHGLSLCYHW